ncbi:MAG: prepilin-type N-terminal cleavage/methylation domain-containing protein [Armatimonadetes bacterium]|nr:prepilin-type N-terminal cleavage/methylation domain-containing protein [Armatimonadota bacterium]
MIQRIKSRHIWAFTLIEMMIVILVIGILLSIAVPQWLHARENSRSTSCVSNLKRITDAKELFAHESNMNTGDNCDMSDLWPDYLQGSNAPSCPAGGTYTIEVIGNDPTCSYVSALFPHIL